jgi:tRNA(Ile)-lysidine synthase
VLRYPVTMPSITDTARATAKRYAMFVHEAPVVALVSGGADSVALLRLLAAGEFGPLGPLSVLHVDHMLRGADAQADATHVAALCADLGVACTVVRFDVAEYAREAALNLEDAGRQVRYRFADEALDAACIAARVSPELGRVATAHNRDDRVETFFMRAITGAGATGFASIPYVRGRIVRPLLDCDRALIRAYLTELGQLWREDATNADTSRLRALIRADIVPIAERVNPAFRETLARSIDLLADDDALLSRMASEFGRDFTDVTADGRLEFDRQRMQALDRVMIRRAVRSALLATFPEASRLDSSHIEAVVDGLSDDSFARDLPNGLRAQNEYGRLIVSRSAELPVAVAPSLLAIPGTADLGSAGRIIAEEVAPADIAVGPYSVTIAADSLGSLAIDGVRPGDRMRPLGMKGSRKLADLLIDEKVPRRQRSAMPVVRDGDRIIWLAGVRMSDEYRVGVDTRRAVRLTWERD